MAVFKLLVWLCILSLGGFSNTVLAYNQAHIKQVEIENVECDKLLDTLTNYARKFKPTELRLDKSITKDSKLNAMLSRIDMACLKNSENKSKYIVAIILLKQYAYHLKCCNQSYDLLTMADGNAKILVDYFLILTKQNKSSLELLSSHKVVELAYKDEYLCAISSINEVLVEIVKQEKRIVKKGV